MNPPLAGLFKGHAITLIDFTAHGMFLLFDLGWLGEPKRSREVARDRHRTNETYWTDGTDEIAAATDSLAMTESGLEGIRAAGDGEVLNQVQHDRDLKGLDSSPFAGMTESWCVHCSG